MNEETRDVHPSLPESGIDPKVAEQADGVSHKEPDIYGNLVATEHFDLLVRSRDDTITKIAPY